MKERLRVNVRFFSARNGGRRMLPAQLLSSRNYMPHLVVGNPNQKTVLVNEKNEIMEDYLGVVFVAQDAPLIEEKDIVAEIETLYPGVDYSKLVRGATFTIREGGSVVDNGEVLQTL